MDTSPVSTGIHNFLTTVTFTPRELHFLSNGLRFIPTPSRSALSRYSDQYFDQAQTGFKHYERNLKLKFIFKDRHETEADSNPASDSSSYCSKFHLTSTHTDAFIRRFENDVRSTGDAIDYRHLEQYLSSTKSILNQSIQSSHTRSCIQHQPRNHTSEQSDFIRRLTTNPAITIKQADKNLGIALVDTDWYVKEINRMLSDTRTYSRCRFHLQNTEKKDRSPALLQQSLLDQLHVLIKRHSHCIEMWFNTTGSQMIKYLKEKITMANASIPEIYLLIKVHKPSGLCGRPIVPCTWSITTPASVVVDHMLQRIIAETGPIPWLVKSTKSLVNEFEVNRYDEFGSADAPPIFVTADIGSLYTNLSTKMGIELIEKFLIERNIPTAHQRVILDLLTFVMSNSYLSFQSIMYQQIDGTAMGTACAPTYANIIVYMLERDKVTKMINEKKVFDYKRFLDDIWAYVAPSAIPEFKQTLNSLHPRLVFEFTVSSQAVGFLDLYIFRGERFQRDGRLDIRVHQKSMNLYLYIPFHSFHTDAAKRSWIVGELRRYIINSSEYSDYCKMKKIFYQRLRDRGYPNSFLQPLFHSIWYCDRPLFLADRSQLLTMVESTGITPKSMGIATTIRRLQQQNASNTNTTNTSTSDPLIFKIPYSPLSLAVSTRDALLTHWDLLHSILPNVKKPIIAYENQPSITVKLIVEKMAREKKQREQRDEALRQPSATPLTQTRIHSFFH